MTSRDPDALIRTWLSEGAEDPSVQLPDRVIDAIAADIHLTRRRAGSGPWRFFDMSRIAIASVAAVVAVVVAGAALIGLNRPAASVGATAPPPSLAAAASAPAVPPSAQPSIMSTGGDLAIGSPFPAQDVIDAGSTYHTVGMTLPLAFTMPAYSSAPTGRFNAQTWSDVGLKVYWNNDHAVTITDGIKVTDNICSPRSVIDTPSTLAGVRTWLFTNPSNAAVLERANLPLSDGSRAEVFDVNLGPHCFSGSEPPPGTPPFWFSAGEQHRVYVVPTPGRAILVVTFAPPGDTAAMNAGTDALVQSLQFR